MRISGSNFINQCRNYYNWVHQLAEKFLNNAIACLPQCANESGIFLGTERPDVACQVDIES